MNVIPLTEKESVAFRTAVAEARRSMPEIVKVLNEIVHNDGDPADKIKAAKLLFEIAKEDLLSL